MNYKKILLEILESQTYLCLATSDTDNAPWASPIAYASDENAVLYFISHTESLHIKNIKQNKKVAISIYDSHQPLRNAFWVQASGICEQVDEWHVPLDAKQKLFDRVSLAVLSKDYAFFQIKLEDIYLPDAERWKEFHDLRVRVEL